MINKMHHLPVFQFNCNNCNENIDSIIYSRAFTTEDEFVCSKCGLLLFISPYDYVFRYIAKKHQIKNSQLTLLEIGNIISNYLLPCNCGGIFSPHGRNYNLYRCPYCSEKLDEKLIIKALNIDEDEWRNYSPFCSNIIINGEHISYTNPGIETKGHLKREFNEKWRKDIKDKKYNEAIKENENIKNDIKNENQRHKKQIHNLKSGILPENIFLEASLNSGLFYKDEKYGTSYELTYELLNLTEPLINECFEWSSLGEYIENGVWGNIDDKIAKEKYDEFTWNEYKNIGEILQEKLQDFFGKRTNIILRIYENKPFHEQ